MSRLRDHARPITEHLRLPVIPEPDPGSRTVLIREGAGTVLLSGEETGLSLDCGACGAPLVTGLKRAQVRAVVIQCNGCKRFNET
jgi:hypothetical protein